MLKDNAAIANEISIELVIVNDSPEIDIKLDHNLIQDFEISIINHSENMGIQQARITGVEAAKGEYILMLDQDDEIQSEAIRSQYELVKGHDAVISNGFNESKDGVKTLLYKSKHQQARVNNLILYFYFGNIIASPGLCLIKKSAIPEIWLHNIININGADDWLLWVSYLNSGHKFCLNEKCLYTHRNDGNNTSDDEYKMLKSSKEALDIIRGTGGMNRHMLSVYGRRLKMRYAYLDSGKIKKVIQYLRNPDIMIAVFIYNKLI